MNFIKHFNNSVLAFCLFSLVYLAGLIVFWQVYPYETADVSVPIEVQNTDDRLQPGENLELLIIIDKAGNYNAQVQRGVLCDDGDYYSVTPVDRQDNLPKGEFIRRRFFTLSERMPIGAVCYFQFNLTYKVNPIRDINKQWISEPFEIIEREL